MKPADIRRVAKERALKEVEKQKADFMSWGVMGDWENAYKTLGKDRFSKSEPMQVVWSKSILSYIDKGFEIRQLRVFNEMVKKGIKVTHTHGPHVKC
jgi:isoleucyl-tRNA synthetase